nr:AsmA-like C-terminal region-containing protein [Schlegelella koreensis]
MRRDAARLELGDVEIRVGTSDARGTVALNTGAERTDLTAELTSRSVALADFGPRSGRGAAETTQAGAREEAAAPRARPRDQAAAPRPGPGASAPRPLSETAASAAASAPAAATAAAPAGAASAERGVRPFGATVRWQAATLKLPASRAPLTGVRVQATLADRVLEARPLEFAVAGGRATGSASVDFNADSRGWRTTLDWRGVRLEQLLGQTDVERRVEAVLNGSARLAARGRAQDDWLASVAGSVDLQVTGGSLPASLDAKLALHGPRVLGAMLTGGRAPIRCARAGLDVENGIARSRGWVLDTEGEHVVGRGSIDLRRRRLDVLLTPEAKGASWLALDRSIRIEGPWQTPARRLVDRVALPAPAACRAAG